MDIELLAPGGSYESVIAAFNAGADAVYTGGEMFGARANADNLTTEQLIDAINYAHIHNRKLYLTVNTLLRDDEINEKLYNYILPLYENGLDAVIVQDMGVFNYIRTHFPDLHIHASTQMTIFGRRTAQELKKLGATRVVLPRELSLNEIKDIHENVDIEIECFVHGALCYCYSGQCFLSSYIGGRSGNRGRCAQPCRMEYDVMQGKTLLNPGDSKYALSPKDICTLNILPDIIESGVHSLKIEGRMKKTEYIAGVVSIYRKYIDLYLKNKSGYKVDSRDIDILYNLFNRNGFNESYYKVHNGREMISFKKPSFRSGNEALTSNIKNKYIGKKLKETFDIKITCKHGIPFTISANVYGKAITASGMIPDKAQKRPVDKETILKQVLKTGDTDFIFNSAFLDLDDGLFLTVGEIKNVRRKLLNLIYQDILSSYKRNNHGDLDKIIKTNEYVSDVKDSYHGDMCINVLLSTYEQLQIALLKKYIDKIYIELQFFDIKAIKRAINLMKENHRQVYIAMPYVSRLKDIDIFLREYKYEFEKETGISGFLIRNLEQYYFLHEFYPELEYIFDYNVYSYNGYARGFYVNNYNVVTTAPAELNLRQLKARKCNNEEFVVYGYMPAMISAGCCIKNTDKCTHNNTVYTLKDSKNNKFVTKCVCKYCYNIMYNCKPLSLFKYQKDIESLNLKSVRINLTIENSEQTGNILTMAENAFIKKIPVVADDTTTRGHFNRGVM